ncbi:PucR family transcriptional regulator [Actinomadura parmotrematis]|uniref:Helix-turn-helix domain-containing protein n=1 Tax=Actinomadura parmotrematis TaxID=2864039 RepID=A0ABS7G1C7_9ACTN|nr:helix-turn-helix domain-containing protein [Actinomadura parmotrematis]MBW8486296.1 helix-turn-helix domain-containing protein [Actinomadura parmotrematis]
MPADLQSLAEDAADLLGAPATLEDRDFHLVAYAAHGDTIDPVRMESILHRRSTDAVRSRFEHYGIARATGPVRIPADHAAGVLGRLCLPVRWNNVTYGYLWLLDDEERITPALAAEAAPLCERAGLLMARQARERDDLGWKLADLLSSQPDVRAAAADELAETGALEPPLAVAVLRAPGPDPRPLNPWLLPRSILTAVWEGDHVLVASAASPLPAVERARRLLEERGPAPSAAGLCTPVTSLAAVREGWLRARVAARAAAPGETRDWSSLGALRLLRVAGDAALSDAVLSPGIARLLAHPDLAATARLYLDHAGSAQATASALAVHRQTLYHRLHRIESLTGLTLTNGQDRLTLHLALTLSPHLNGS